MRYPTTSRAYASMHECSSNFNTNKYTVYYGDKLGKVDRESECIVKFKSIFTRDNATIADLSNHSIQKHFTELKRASAREMQTG